MATEFEITPEMIRAGVKELYAGTVCDDPRSVDIEKTVRAIFQAMIEIWLRTPDTNLSRILESNR